jgi:hypothetical protein
MTNFTTKQLCFIGRIGPAFSLDEIPAAHAVLDRASVPRRLKGASLTLPERISYLNGMLATARIAATRRQIIIISKQEHDAFTSQQYQETEVTP